MEDKGFRYEVSYIMDKNRINIHDFIKIEKIATYKAKEKGYKVFKVYKSILHGDFIYMGLN